MFLAIETALDPFVYSGSLVGKVKRLIKMVANKEGALTETNQNLEVSQNPNEELEKALKVSQDSQRKVEVGLNNMRRENLSLCKELPESVQEGFFYGR